MNYPIGSQLMVNGIMLTCVSTFSIRTPDVTTLKQSKLDALQKVNPLLGFDRFSDVINDPNWRGNRADLDVIRLTKIPQDSFGICYEIVNGRHRVYLATKLRYNGLWAWVDNT